MSKMITCKIRKLVLSVMKPNGEFRDPEKIYEYSYHKPIWRQCHNLEMLAHQLVRSAHISKRVDIYGEDDSKNNPLNINFKIQYDLPPEDKGKEYYVDLENRIVVKKSFVELSDETPRGPETERGKLEMLLWSYIKVYRSNNFNLNKYL